MSFLYILFLTKMKHFLLSQKSKMGIRYENENVRFNLNCLISYRLYLRLGGERLGFP